MNTDTSRPTPAVQCATGGPLPQTCTQATETHKHESAAVQAPDIVAPAVPTPAAETAEIVEAPSRPGRKPWDRQHGESPPAFAAFQAWLAMGQGRRSTRAVAVELGKHLSLIQRWCGRRGHGWIARGEAYDRHMNGIAQRAEEKAVEASAGTWAARLAASREADLLAAGRLREKALSILRRCAEDGTLGEAVRALAVASRLERVACGAETSDVDREPAHVQQQAVKVEIVLPDNRRDRRED